MEIPPDGPDLGGWGPRAWDQLRKDVDYVLAFIRGKPVDDKDVEDPRLLGVGITTWIALLTAGGTLIGTIAAVFAQNP